MCGGPDHCLAAAENDPSNHGSTRLESCRIRHLSPKTSYIPQPNTKDRVIDAVRDLPDDATVVDAMERLYFLAKVEEGLRQAEAGETVTAEEAHARIFE